MEKPTELLRVGGWRRGLQTNSFGGEQISVITFMTVGLRSELMCHEFILKERHCQKFEWG